MKNFIHEPSRDLPIAGEYDVIVAGSGPAGVSAAINAGRRGAKVLLLEWNNAVGGISTHAASSHEANTVPPASAHNSISSAPPSALSSRSYSLGRICPVPVPEESACGSSSRIMRRIIACPRSFAYHVRDQSPLRSLMKLAARPMP